MKDFRFVATPEVLDLGIRIITVKITAVKNSLVNEEFEIFKQGELEKLRKQWASTNYKDDTVLAGFRELHTKVGRSNRDYIASPESLRRIFIERDRFPQINTLVDIYNLISLKTGLALGAHDMEKVSGNVKLRMTTGREKFTPLGKTEPANIFPDEYGYVDEEDNLICRLEVLQTDHTKVSIASKDIFMIIEGNEHTELDYIKDSAIEVCSLITKYCGGSYVLLDANS